MSRLFAVTGALGYSGRRIAQRLLDRGDRVRTLTNSPGRPNPFGDALEVRPLAFDNPAALAGALRGVDVLVNTYWVRFNHARFTFAAGVANSRALFAAAAEAGVRRIVHTSILRAEDGRGLGYYEGKLAVEEALRRAGPAWAIVRPGVLFGRGDILVNNIAWALRRLPVFGVFGDGRYRLRPMHVDDFADLVVACADAEGHRTADAVGPETFEYRDLVRTIAGALGVRRPIVSVPPGAGYLVCRALGPLVGDVIVTREEVEGLMRGLLWSGAESTGRVRLSEWAAAEGETLGRRYASEVRRRLRRDVPYDGADT